MNKVILMGRLTKDVDLKYSNNDSSMAIARYSIAVQRNVKNKEGKYDTDFINCVAFGKVAEFVSKWFHKGSRVLIEGSLRVDIYTNKEGKKTFSTYVLAMEHHFVDSAKSESKETKETASNDIMSGFENIDSSDDELPFM